MKKVLLTSLISIIFFSIGIGQDLDLTLKKGNKEKTLKINERSRVNLTMMSQDPVLGQIYHQLQVKICGKEGDTLSICVINEKKCISKDGTCEPTSETRYIKGNYDERKIAITDIISIQKSSYRELAALHGLAGLVSGAFMVILNPIISYDFDAKVSKGNLWMKAHLISVAVIAESIAFITYVKPKKYQLYENPGAWRIIN